MSKDKLYYRAFGGAYKPLATVSANQLLSNKDKCRHAKYRIGGVPVSSVGSCGSCGWLRSSRFKYTIHRVGQNAWWRHRECRVRCCPCEGRELYKKVGESFVRYEASNNE